MARMRIGTYLLQKGVLTPAQVSEILAHSEKTGLRFGEAGLQLGHLTPENLQRVFGPSYDIDFFHLSPGHFPEKTRELLAPDEIIRFGALPLGYRSESRLFKRGRIYNLGLVNPGREEVKETVLEKVKKEDPTATRLKVFLVLADQFMEVVNSVYGLSVENVLSRPEDEVDETLRMFLSG